MISPLSLAGWYLLRNKSLSGFKRQITWRIASGALTSGLWGSLKRQRDKTLGTLWRHGSNPLSLKLISLLFLLLRGLAESQQIPLSLDHLSDPCLPECSTEDRDLVLCKARQKGKILFKNVQILIFTDFSVELQKQRATFTDVK